MHDISFTLREGEIVAILGRSGAGKSTFLRTMAGLVQPTEGTVTYRGRELTGPNPGVAIVFQTFALMPWLTVQDNVELGLRARGVSKEKRTELALAAIDAIGLDGFETFIILDAAADVVDDLAQGQPKGNLDQTGMFDIPGQSEGLGALGFLSAHAGVPFWSAQDDLRNV